MPKPIVAQPLETRVSLAQIEIWKRQIKTSQHQAEQIEKMLGVMALLRHHAGQYLELATGVTVDGLPSEHEHNLTARAVLGRDSLLQVQRLVYDLLTLWGGRLQEDKSTLESVAQILEETVRVASGGIVIPH